MMNIGPIFSSFLATEDTSSILDPNNIADEILKVKNNGQGFDQHGGWQSNFLEINNILAPLINLIKDRANNIATEALGIKPDVDVRLHNYWANINYSNTPYLIHSNMPHIHVNNLISFVYYAKAHPDCGNLTLLTPVAQQEYTLPMEYTNGNTNPLTTTRMHITPTPGLLVAFNSHVMHHVTPNISGEDRISIALNFALPCHGDAIDLH